MGRQDHPVDTPSNFKFFLPYLNVYLPIVRFGSINVLDVVWISVILGILALLGVSKNKSCFKINYRGFVSMKLIAYFLIYKQQNVNVNIMHSSIYSNYLTCTINSKKASAYNSIKHLLNVKIIMFHS